MRRHTAAASTLEVVVFVQVHCCFGGKKILDRSSRDPVAAR